MSTPEPDRPVLATALVLVLVLAAANLWSNHHFGVGIRNPGGLAAVLASVGAAWGWTARLLTEEEKAAAGASVRRTLRRYLFGPGPVLALSAGFAVAALLFSSVTVVAEPGAGPSVVRVTALATSTEIDSARLDDGTPQLRFGVETSPLAGPYEVRASGYLPAVVEARPIFGARVELGRDVARSPALLVRPAGPLLGLLRNGGHLRIYRRSGGDTVRVAESDRGDAGSFLMGRRTVALSDREASWERQLVAAGVTDQVTLARHVEDWRRTHALPFEGDLAPGDSLLVRLVAPSGAASAEERIVLGAEDVEDVLLRPPTDGGGPP